jgi:hemoglobin
MIRKIKTPFAAFLLAIAGLFVFNPGVLADEPAAPAPSLYERLGGWDGISNIVSGTIERHMKNPQLSHYFENVDLDKLHDHVTAFFAAGTGGPAKYEGRDMTSAHAALGMSDEDFDSAVRDVLSSAEANGVGEKERGEVSDILYSLKPAVMGPPKT